MENILGIILFVAFIIFRSMSDRKKGMTRGPKPKTLDTMPRTKMKPLVQAEPAGTRRMRSGETKPAPPIQKQSKPIQQGATSAPPPFVSTTKRVEEDNCYNSTSVWDDVALPVKKAVPRLQPVAATEVSSTSIVSYDDLRKAVLWSEILAKPRAMRRSIR